MRQIENVFVNGISLVSKENTPAVEQAETGFALFKMQEKAVDVGEIQKNLQKGKIQKILSNIKCPFLER